MTRRQGDTEGECNYVVSYVVKVSESAINTDISKGIKIVVY